MLGFHPGRGRGRDDRGDQRAGHGCLPRREAGPVSAVGRPSGGPSACSSGALVLAAGLTITPELVGIELARSFRCESQLKFAVGSSGVFVIGPGMGDWPVVLKHLKPLCGLAKPAVFDADALNAFSYSKTKWWKWIKAPSILTPHPGEMVRLSMFLDVKYARGIPEDVEGRINVAILAAKTFGQVMVLKGHRTVVTDGDRVYVNRTGDSSLSKAGTGDVLSGIIGALLAQQMDRFDASCAAVWIHGRAGEITGQTLGRRSVLARDVIDSLPQAICDYETQT
jgi:ADP-dependent NAD(P)H-hydrate dehydratase